MREHPNLKQLIIDRRTLLKAALAASSALAMDAVNPLEVFAQRDIVADYVEALHSPHLGLLNPEFQELAGGVHVGLVLYDVARNELLAGLDTETPLPVASCFKGPVAIYFFDTIDPSVWSETPFEEWHTHGLGTILRDLFEMAVKSDNPATGRVLTYIARARGEKNMIASFNQWSQERVNTTPFSGMEAWERGAGTGMDYADLNYIGRSIEIDNEAVSIANMMSARDLALYYIWMQVNLPEDARNMCRRLLSEVLVDGNGDERRSHIQKLAYEFGGISVSKNGSLNRDRGAAATVITDVGLVEFDNEQYVIAVLVAGESYPVLPIFDFIQQVFAGQQAEAISQRREVLRNQEDPWAYVEPHLARAYPETVEPVVGEFNYAFIRRPIETIHTRPDERFSIPNQAINSRHGARLFYPGALLRYEIEHEDDPWAKIVVFINDGLYSRNLQSVYLKRDNLWTIPRDRLMEIGNLVNPDAQKWIFVNIAERYEVLMEGDQPILKFPVIVNGFNALYGSHPIFTNWGSRNMGYAAGIPYTTFMSRQGHANHGSPYQSWPGIRQSEIAKFSTAGCVNIPNWLATVGDLTLPNDELVFRWSGGQKDPIHNNYDGVSGMYIHTGDSTEDLKDLYIPIGVSAQDVAPIIEQFPLSAPDYFFS